MKFIDEVKIEVYSGDGGSGCSSMRREKYVPFGGPDGGNGGEGGSVTFLADINLNTLVNFRGKKIYRALDGGNGRRRQKDGLGAEELIIRVPVGTIIKDIEKDLIIGDLSEEGQTLVVAQGGRGGLGNCFFKTATNQAPRHAQEGEPGQAFRIHMELKLIADIALVGLPNAGKSTLISAISSARPKVADYPFTTLEPNLGVVVVDEDSLVVADIPGLIEDAAEGKGLGVKFLKHIERTSALVHLVDCSMLLEPFEAMEDYATVRSELLKFREEIKNKPEIVCLTKIDAMSDEEIEKFRSEMESQLDKKVLAISSVSGLNIDILKRLMLQTKEARQLKIQTEETTQEEAR